MRKKLGAWSMGHGKSLKHGALKRDRNLFQALSCSPSKHEEDSHGSDRVPIRKAARMEGRSGSGEGDLQSDKSVSEAGAIRIDQSIAASSGFSTCQYRGRERKSPQGGISSVSLYRTRFSLRAADIDSRCSRPGISETRGVFETGWSGARSDWDVERAYQYAQIATPSSMLQALSSHSLTTRGDQI